MSARPRPPLLPWLALCVASTAACAPPIAEQVARGEWYAACRRADDGESQAELHRAMFRELAAGLTLDLEILDRATLARELGVPVEGELAERVLLVRFAGRLASPRLQDAKVVLKAIGDGEHRFGDPEGVEVPLLDEGTGRMFGGWKHNTLSEIGIAELLLAAEGRPEYPDAFKPRMIDMVPIPLAGENIGARRERWHKDAVDAAAAERHLWQADRAKAMQRDPTYGPAAARLTRHLTDGEWKLLRPAVFGTKTSVMEVTVSGRIVGAAGENCRLDTTVSIALAGPEPLASRVAAIFSGGPRPLADLPWEVLVWHGL